MDAKRAIGHENARVEDSEAVVTCRDHAEAGVEPLLASLGPERWRAGDALVVQRPALITRKVPGLHDTARAHHPVHWPVLHQPRVVVGGGMRCAGFRREQPAIDVASDWGLGGRE